jgi:hypothetical protein
VPADLLGHRERLEPEPGRLARDQARVVLDRVEVEHVRRGRDRPLLLRAVPARSTPMPIENAVAAAGAM